MVAHASINTQKKKKKSMKMLNPRSDCLVYRCLQRIPDSKSARTTQRPCLKIKNKNKIIGKKCFAYKKRKEQQSSDINKVIINWAIT